MSTLKLIWIAIFIFVILTTISMAKEEEITFETENEATQSSSVKLESFHIFAKIRYRFAQTKVICKITNYDELNAQEVAFTMDLPEGAFVSNFTLEVDGQLYHSFIKEKVFANEEYLKNRDQANTAGIINEDKNLFNININLVANSTAILYLEYEEEINKVSNNGNSYYQYAVSVIPQVIEANHFCMDVEIIEFKDFEIKMLNLCNEKANCVEIDMQKEAVLLKGENWKSFRVIWEPTIVEGKLQTLIKQGLLGKYKINYEFLDKKTINEVLVRNGYFVHRFYPNNLPRIPIHVIFVLDISESMIGQRMEQLIKAMISILDDLKPHDFFNIITFSSESKIWWPLNNMDPEQDFQHYPAFPTDYMFTTMAKFYIKHLEFFGSTNIYAALMDALQLVRYSTHTTKMNNNFKNRGNLSKEYQSPTPMIFFLTDGAATSGIVDPSEILKKVGESNTVKAPIFSLAFGSTADFSLLQTLSLQNYGIARRIYDDVNADLQLKDFYDFVASPILKNLTFQYTSNLLQLSELTSHSVSWLPMKSEITTAGRLEADARVNQSHLSTSHGIQPIMSYIVLGEGQEQRYEFKARICPCGLCSNIYMRNETSTFSSHYNPKEIFCNDNQKEEDLFAERFWAHKMLKNLIHEAIKQGNSTVIERILELSQKYNLVTPFTSLLIITPDNRESYNPPSISTLLFRDNNKDDTLPIKITKPKKSINNNMKMKKYSTSALSSTLHDTLNDTDSSLMSYLNLLISEQKTILNSRANSLKITDIKWLTNSENKLTLWRQRDNQTYSFQILLSNEEKENKSLPVCYRDSIKGKCTHLVNCIENEFLDNIQLFVKSYFCPLFENRGPFVGTCCL